MLKTAQLLRSLLLVLITTVAQSIQFLRLALCSRAALSAEGLFLRKQLAFYREHQISLRKLTPPHVFLCCCGRDSSTESFCQGRICR